MNPILYGAVFAVLIAVGILVLLEVGRRIGARRLAVEGEDAVKGFGAIEGAVFALLGLILAFSFSGALTRFDAQRQLVIAEANNIGTAFLRLDLLPADAQAPVRDLFRRYLDSRIETYRKQSFSRAPPRIKTRASAFALAQDRFAETTAGVDVRNVCLRVDGFNLYFGALRKTPHRWLGLQRLIELHLKSQNQLVGIKYFTAKLNPRPNDPDAPARQEMYLRALATLPNLEITLGHFLTKNVRMLLANPTPGQPPTAEVVKTGEKGSDVNLAVQLVHDAHLNRFDCAVIVSGDSDLLMPVKIVRNELNKVVGVLNPQRHPCAVLKASATFYKHLRPNFVAAAQFPETLTDARGTFSRPPAWQ